MKRQQSISLPHKKVDMAKSYSGLHRITKKEEKDEMKQCVARLLQHARLMVGNLVDLEFVYIPSGMSGDKDDPRNDVAYIGWKYMGWDHPSKRKIPTKTHDNKASKLFHDTWEGMRA